MQYIEHKIKSIINAQDDVFGFLRFDGATIMSSGFHISYLRDMLKEGLPSESHGNFEQ